MASVPRDISPAPSTQPDNSQYFTRTDNIVRSLPRPIIKPLSNHTDH